MGRKREEEKEKWQEVNKLKIKQYNIFYNFDDVNLLYYISTNNKRKFVFIFRSHINFTRII